MCIVHVPIKKDMEKLMENFRVLKRNQDAERKAMRAKEITNMSRKPRIHSLIIWAKGQNPYLRHMYR